MDQGKGKKSNYVPFETFIKRRIRQEAAAKRSVTKFVELRAAPLEAYRKQGFSVSPEMVVAGFFVVTLLVLAMLLAGAT